MSFRFIHISLQRIYAMPIRTVFFDIGNTLVRDKKWIPGAKEAIVELKKRKIRVGIISNTGDMSRDELAGLLPVDFEFDNFDSGLVMLSSETGLEKPGVQTYSLAIQHCGCSPWETMFVGEDLSETIAAQFAGMIAARCVDAIDFDELVKFIANQSR